MTDDIKKRRFHPKEYADREYVDQSIDALRHYSETLFGKAESRVFKVLNEMVDAKLKLALETIRPQFDGAGEEAKRGPDVTTAVASQNETCIKELGRRMCVLADEYEVLTGFRVRSVHFIGVGDRMIAKPLVYNP